MMSGLSHPIVAGPVAAVDVATRTVRATPIDAAMRSTVLAIASSTGVPVREMVVTCVAAETRRSEKAATPASQTGRIHAANASTVAADGATGSSDQMVERPWARAVGPG